MFPMVMADRAMYCCYNKKAPCEALAVLNCSNKGDISNKLIVLSSFNSIGFGMDI